MAAAAELGGGAAGAEVCGRGCKKLGGKVALVPWGVLDH